VRLLYLNQWFEPEPCLKGLAFAEGLTERGIETTVITGFPNYPTGVVYDGYRIRWHEVEEMGKVIVHRVALYPSHDANAVKRILNYASFAASAFVRALMMARRHDALYAYHPPMTVALVAVVVGKITRRPVIVEVQDLWPESLAATGMADHPAITRVVGAMAGFVYRHADAIVAQSQGFHDAITRRGGDPRRITVVRNWTAELPSGEPERLSEDFNVLYAGNLGPAQGLDTVLDAAALLLHDAPHVRIHLMGTGQSEPALMARVEREHLHNIEFHPLQHPARVGAYLAGADALLVTLKPDPLFDITIPSKTQTSLAAGRPVVMAVRGEAADLVAEAGAGPVVPPGDAAALARTLRELAATPQPERDRMGDAGRRFYQRHLSMAAGLDLTAQTIRSVVRT
jgi:glycosyltransferase involved in cell wall biosynthesis